MRKSKFSEEQIIYALKQAELGIPVLDGSSSAFSNFLTWSPSGSRLLRTAFADIRHTANATSSMYPWPMAHVCFPARIFSPRAIISSGRARALAVASDIQAEPSRAGPIVSDRAPHSWWHKEFTHHVHHTYVIFSFIMFTLVAFAAYRWGGKYERIKEQEADRADKDAAVAPIQLPTSTEALTGPPSLSRPARVTGARRRRRSLFAAFRNQGRLRQVRPASALERQARLMAHHGLKITSQTLWDQCSAITNLLEPTYYALFALLRASPVVRVDQTGWPDLGDRSLPPWQM